MLSWAVRRILYTDSYQEAERHGLRRVILHDCTFQIDVNTLSGDEPLVFDRCVLQNCKIQLKGVGGSLFIFRSVERVKIIFSSAALVNSEILDASILFGKGILLTTRS